jgi:hypothetical protein
MKNIRYFGVTLLSFLLLSIVLSGCGNSGRNITTTTTAGNLQIRVVDLNSQPVPGAKVVSEEQPAGQLKVTGLTDGSGDVTFNDIKAGTYRFYFSHADFTQAEQAVTVTGGQTATITVSMAEAGQAADDIAVTPGGPAYRANVQQQGVTNPWPPITTTTSTLDNTNGPAEITYRGNIQTLAGQTRNNLFYITLPNVSPMDTSLPALSISLKAQNLPAGITAAQTDLQWHDGDPGRRAATAMTIQIYADVKAGDYIFNVDIVLNNIDYGTLLCTVSVTG